MRGRRKGSARSNEQTNEHDDEDFTSSGKSGKENKENDVNKTKLKEKIAKFREDRNKKLDLNNLVVIKRSNKIFQAMSLPKVLNLNPRSIYNKADEFMTFVK